MSLPTLALLTLFGLTALNWTIHWYTQVVTYRLFPEVARHTGDSGFVAYHRAYQTRLVWAIYLPWSALMIVSIAVVVAPPAGHTLAAWSLLALNAAIGMLSIVFAAPIHARIDRQDRLDAADAAGLLRSNLARLVVASISLAGCTTLTFSAAAQGLLR